MKSLTISLICGFVLIFYALAESKNAEPDLSTPKKTIESFFGAVKANNYNDVINMLSPRLKRILLRGSVMTTDDYIYRCKDYIKAWNQFPVIRIGKAETGQLNTDRKPLAKTEVIFLIDGKEYLSRVDTVRIDGKWLWDGNWGYR